MSDPGADDGPSDRDLLAAHVAGDADAFGVLFARHRDRLWAVALRTTGDREVAADGLQDGLVSAFRRASTFRGEAQVTTWLHRIVVNACLDRLRSARVRRTETLPEGPHAAGPGGTGGEDTGSSARSGPAAGAADPERHALDQERRRAVVTALAELAPEQRAAVVLVDMEGFSVAEAAVVLDCPVGTVKSRCSRARARLAISLAPLLDDEEGTTRPRPDVAGGNRSAPPDVGSVAGRSPPPPAAPAPPTASAPSAPSAARRPGSRPPPRRQDP